MIFPVRHIFAGILLLVSCTGSINHAAAQTGARDIDTITNRLITIYLEDSIAIDKATLHASSLKENGSWQDLPFEGSSPTRFSPVTHLDRLREMAVAFRKPGTAMYAQEPLYKKIVAGLSFYYQQKPVSVNWWFNQIGAPQQYMVVLLLLKGFMPEEEMQRFASMLKDETGNERHRGKNRTWISAITIHKGCLENNIDLVSKGFTSIASVISMEPEQGIEGIKPDYSFHQHHEQLYSGGYGLSIIDDLASYLLLAKNTRFEESFTSAKKTLLADLLLQGHQLFGFRTGIDFGTVGRNISRPNHVANISASVLDKMMVADPLHASAYESWKKHLSGGAFPVAFRGNKYFWKSAIMTQHGADYYLSAKIVSSRTLGTESLNGENIRGFNLPLGAVNIATTGHEYTHIFPVWDWTKVPGTTAGNSPDSTLLDGYLYGKNNYGGCVSNGKAGVIAFESDYRNIQAKKSYFFIGDALLCLGAGINSIRNDSVSTSVNQCLLSGEVKVHYKNIDDTIKKENPGVAKPDWIYHDGVGYIFPSGGNISCTQNVQSGSWRDINKGGDTAIQRKSVFNLWIDHGSKPINSSYAYIILPERSLDTFAKKASQHGFVILRNDTTVQAVYNDAQHITAAVFYQRGTINFSNGLQLQSDKPALVIIQQKGDSYEISVADPLYTQQTIRLTLNKRLTGMAASSTGSGTSILIQLPSGDDAGRTVTHTYSFSTDRKTTERPTIVN